MNLNARRKRRRRARRRLAQIAAVCAFVGVGYGLERLIAWPGFTLHRLVVTGVREVARSEVVARANIDPHADIWLMNTGAVSKRIEAIPRVLAARVRRSLPGNVRIEITERKPAGCVIGADGRRATIDETRRILTEDCPADVLPRYVVGAVFGEDPGAVLQNETLQRLQNDDRVLETGEQRFARLALDRFGDLDAQLTSGVTIRFGDDADLARKERLVGPILHATAANFGRVRAIDLRSAATPVVEFRDPDARTAADRQRKS